MCRALRVSSSLATEEKELGTPSTPLTGTPGLLFIASGACSPHPEKRSTGGEDAHMILPLATGGVLALADGVGGWKDYGINAGLYSRRLLQNTADALMQAEGPADPREVLAKAHDATCIPGAATACIVVLDGAAKKIQAVNLGDSGFRILRDGQWAFASPAQQHYFDCPFQLGHPKYVPETDNPSDAAGFEEEVMPGDIVLLASDGVFDNLRAEQIRQLVVDASKSAGQQSSPLDRARAVAEAVVAKARECANDSGYLSPYIEEATKAGKIQSPFGALAATMGMTPKGGKQDDISVVAAVIVDGAQEGSLALLQKSLEAATAATAAIPSAVGDAKMEKREVWLEMGEDVDKRVTRRETAEATAAEVTSGQRKALFTASEIGQMDATLLRNNLQRLGLPTSGKIDNLRKRLAAVPAP